MKILYLITGLGLGGAEKVVVELADQMTQNGYQVKIAYLKGHVIVRPQNENIDLVYLGFESLKDLKVAYQNYKSLIINFQPDVVHAHMVHANIFARISRFLYPIPKLICTAHNSNEGNYLRMLAYRITNKFSDINTNVSREATQKFIKLGAFNKKNSITIYNGINTLKFFKKLDSKIVISNELKIHIDTKILLAVGRFHEQKDYPNLIKAISLLKEVKHYNDKFLLLIAGDGNLKTIIHNMIIDYGLSEQVILLGQRSDISELMSAADIFVLSSAWEGFGLVVAEAMACECFVVATDCGGVKEVMGDNGILIKPNNSYELSEALNIALHKSEAEISTNNRQALEYIKSNFALEKIIRKWMKLYEL